MGAIERKHFEEFMCNCPCRVVRLEEIVGKIAESVNSPVDTSSLVDRIGHLGDSLGLLWVLFLMSVPAIIVILIARMD